MEIEIEIIQGSEVKYYILLKFFLKIPQRFNPTT